MPNSFKLDSQRILEKSQLEREHIFTCLCTLAKSLEKNKALKQQKIAAEEERQISMKTMILKRDQLVGIHLSGFIVTCQAPEVEKLQTNLPLKSKGTAEQKLDYIAKAIVYVCNSISLLTTQGTT